MMSNSGTQTAGRLSPGTSGAPPPERIELSEEDKSKDAFFVQLAGIAEAMIGKHGKDFAMGTLVLTAKLSPRASP